jgi:hypothetical protein
MFDPEVGILSSTAPDNCHVQATLGYKTHVKYVDLLQLITNPILDYLPDFRPRSSCGGGISRILHGTLSYHCGFR